MNKGEKNELTFQSPDRVLDELEKKSQNAPKARKIALILEDSKFDLEKITMYLKMSDSEVHIVSKRTIFDAKKYVFFERIRNPDAKILVLADFYLEKNELGTDLLKACQSISSKDIRLCLMSNSSINKVALKKIESLDFAFISKSLRPMELASAFKYLLSETFEEGKNFGDIVHNKKGIRRKIITSIVWLFEKISFLITPKTIRWGGIAASILLIFVLLELFPTAKFLEFKESMGVKITNIRPAFKEFFLGKESDTEIKKTIKKHVDKNKKSLEDKD